MKNTLVRVFVLSLVVTGFGSATVISRAAATKNVAKVNAPKTGMIPGCVPSDPSKCGMD